MMLTGDVEAFVEPEGVANYIGTNQHGFASLKDNAKLAMLGGTLSGATETGISGDALFTATDSAELVFDGFTATATIPLARRPCTCVTRASSATAGTASD
jgi:hypothetical protein